MKQIGQTLNLSAPAAKTFYHGIVTGSLLRENRYKGKTSPQILLCPHTAGGTGEPPRMKKPDPAKGDLIDTVR